MGDKKKKKPKNKITQSNKQSVNVHVHVGDKGKNQSKRKSSRPTQSMPVMGPIRYAPTISIPGFMPPGNRCVWKSSS